MITNRIFTYIGNDPDAPAQRFNLDYELGKRQVLAAVVDYLKDSGWSSKQATIAVDRIFDMVQLCEDKVLRNVSQSVYECCLNPDIKRKELLEVFIPIFWAREGRKVAEAICESIKNDDSIS